MNHLSLILFPVEARLYLPDPVSASRYSSHLYLHLKRKERERSVTVLLWKGPSEAMHVYVSVRPSRQLSQHLTKALVKLSAGLGVHKHAYVHVHACVHVALTHVKSQCVCVGHK